jgi:hypothetical protein
MARSPLGHRSVGKVKIHMAHKTGFTCSTLNDALFKAGSKFNLGAARPGCYEFGIVPFKQLMSDEESMKIAMNDPP